MAEPIQAPIPLLNIPIVDKNGFVSRAWMMFFLSLQARTGGASGEDNNAANEDEGRTWALSVESTLSQPLPDVSGGALAVEALITPPIPDMSGGFSNETIPAPSTVDMLAAALSQESIYPHVVGVPTLPDIVASVLNYERDFAQGSSALQVLNDIIAPLVYSAVSDILGSETVSAPGVPQNAISEMVAAAGQGQNAVSDMTFAPTQSTAFARDPIQVVATSSPITVVARGPYATLSIDGGTITNITVTRGTWSRTVGNTTPFIAMSPGDTVTITYVLAPTLYFLPRI
jgi:hypothetical protein